MDKSKLNWRRMKAAPADMNQKGADGKKRRYRYCPQCNKWFTPKRNAFGIIIFIILSVIIVVLTLLILIMYSTQKNKKVTTKGAFGVETVHYYEDPQVKRAMAATSAGMVTLLVAAWISLSYSHKCGSCKGKTWSSNKYYRFIRKQIKKEAKLAAKEKKAKAKAAK